MEPTVAQRSRCHTHPGRAAIGACGACGRPGCLECAIPVRGELVGQECLRRVLPDPPPLPDPGPAGPSLADRVAATAFAVAAMVSLFAWSRFGAGAGGFTPWGLSPPRWAWLAGAPAVIGLLLASVGARARSRLPGALRGWLAVLFGGIVLSGAVLFVWWPPFATRANFVPWIAAAAATTAVGAGVALLRAARLVA